MTQMDLIFLIRKIRLIRKICVLLSASSAFYSYFLPLSLPRSV